MIYPVGDGTKKNFEKYWYIADGFGSDRDTYVHSGVDINLRTGGNTDMGQPVLAIAAGKLEYYHNNSHPTKSFGRHNVYHIEGPWGVRWVHSAHMQQKDFLGTVKNISEGEKVGLIGNSGTNLAHLHLSIFKVDPATLPKGIDTIANRNTINQYWEDPISFIGKWYGQSSMGQSPELEECLRQHTILVDENVKTKEQNIQLQRQIDDLQREYKYLKEDSAIQIRTSQDIAKEQKEKYEAVLREVATILGTTQDIATIYPELNKLVEVEALYEKEKKNHKKCLEELDLRHSENDQLNAEIARLREEARMAKGLGDATTADLINEIIKRLKAILVK